LVTLRQLAQSRDYLVLVLFQCLAINSGKRKHYDVEDGPIYLIFGLALWPVPGSEDTELGVLMELEVGHGETEVYPRVQA
jgi:hypothetical protein